MSTRGRCEVVAPVDSTPLSLLASALTLHRRRSDADIRISMLAIGSRTEVAARLAKLLRRPRLEVDIHTLPGGKDDPDKLAQLVELLETAGACQGAERALDISGASGDLALRAYRAAVEMWRGGFETIAFNPTLNATRFVGPDGVEEIVEIDLGDKDDCPGGEITPARFLGLFGLQLRPEDPYHLTGLKRAEVDAALLPAARGVLEVSCHAPDAYAAFRQQLAMARKSRSKAGVRVNDAGLLEPVRPILDQLAHLGLARVEDDGFAILGARDRGGVFFLSGGWLELLVGDALQRALGRSRRVERNAGTVWGTGSIFTTPYAEADAVFIRSNRLHVVSCKNEFVDERIYSHLDRLRALVAEYGEAWVRPVILSTKPLDELARKRCSSYEIGAVDGPELLRILMADQAEPAAGQLLNAVERAASRPPAPGA